MISNSVAVLALGLAELCDRHSSVYSGSRLRLGVRSVLSDASVIAAEEQVISCELAGGAALLDLRSGTYFGLNEIGSEIWA